MAQSDRLRQSCVRPNGTSSEAKASAKPGLVRTRVGVAAAVMLVVSLGSVGLEAGTASASGTTTRTVSQVSGAYLTSYHYADGTSLQVLDSSGPIDAAPKLDSDPNDPTGPKTVAGEIDNPSVPAGMTKSQLGDKKMMSEAEATQALGADSATVAAFAEQDKTNGIPPYSQSGSITAAKHEYWFRCIHWNGDDGHLNFYGCWRQFLAHKDPQHNAHWTMADHFYSTGSMSDSGFNADEITGLQQGLRYSATGNVITDWSPKNTFPGENNCPKQTFTVQVFGQTYTSTSSGCKAKYGYKYSDYTSFLTKWDGNDNGPSDGARDTSGVDEVDNPATALPNITATYWYVWWD